MITKSLLLKRLSIETWIAATAPFFSFSSVTPPLSGKTLESHRRQQQQQQQQINDLISSLCKNKRFREAIRTFHSLTPHLRLFPSTFAHLFLACSHLRSLPDARLLHRHLVASPFCPDVVLHNHILNAYGKCGSPDDARRLFDAMPQRNLVSWTSVISGFSQNGRHQEAVELYCEVLRSGLLPDQYALGSVVRACSGLADGELGRQLHSHAVKLDCGADRIVQNALVMMYARLDRINEAALVFEMISDKDVISWGSMLAGFAQQGYELDALHLFKEMISSGVHSPNEFHFGSAFNACGSIGNLNYGEQIHGLCAKFGLARNEFAGCSLSDMYARCKMLDRANKAFKGIEMPDLVSWNSIISGFSSLGLSDESMSLFSEMRDLGVQPDDITIRSLLCAFTGYDSFQKGQLVHSYALKTGLIEDIAVSNSLLMMHTKCTELPTALDLFEGMKNRDLVSWNTILSACLQHQEPEQVFSYTNLMQNLDSRFDQITLSVILNACASLAYLEMGTQVHSHALKIGLEVDIMVRNALIDTYSKCGALGDAKKVFKLADEICDVFSWSSLILGYAQSGHAKESLELFMCMIDSGIKPNHVTYVGVLTACRHAGLVDQGLYLYDMMEAEHGIAPTREHCSCMIDMLSRAGRLPEAESFINQMPFEPDILMWKSILAACRMHNNVEIGKRAAENILKVDPQNSGAYVLLCNIYASAGYWEDFAMLRKTMRSNIVKKSPGKSWVKVKRDVHVFTVEDRSHPESKGIYETLQLLGSEMLDSCYDVSLPNLHE